ncbi:hypothetical protein B0H10DRAFT_2026406 [Mycena sp. CBHHK59/15]|nr:hypothetical protein B0H10DRAFT_2026406 [Mycena sp. CBHHK59/15]
MTSTLHGSRPAPGPFRALIEQCQAFTHVPEVAEHSFCVLCVEAPMKKIHEGWVVKKDTSYLLKPIQGGKVMGINNRQRSLANSFVRGAGCTFESLIYIAINSSGPNLRFKGVVEDPNDPLTSDSELGSGEEGGTGASDEVTDTSHTQRKQKKDPLFTPEDDNDDDNDDDTQSSHCKEESHLSDSKENNTYLFLEQDDDMVSDHEVKYKGEKGKGKAFEA